MNRKPLAVVLAEAMWQLHAQEKSWDELIPLEQEQMLFEAQHCIEALQEGGWAIIAQATQEEFDEVQRTLGRRSDIRAAARLRVQLGEKIGDLAPDWVYALAGKAKTVRPPYTVVGLGPFRLPGERRAWRNAEKRAREMLASIEKDKDDG